MAILDACFINLIYRGSNNHFSFSSFIKICKGKSPTLCVVKTKRGRIYGMFTDIAWDDTNEKVTGYHNSFIFNFDGDILN